jgi:RNA polymerase sigma-70 factor (ECF subfamily)
VTDHGTSSGDPRAPGGRTSDVTGEPLATTPGAIADRVVAPSTWERDVRARMDAGDEAALREVYDQYASFVYGLAKRVIGDPRAAEDVSQDVFCSVWERPGAFDPDRGSLRTWLGTLTHRRAVDYVRREEARRRRAERAAARAVPVPDVEEIATAVLTAERVRAALDALPEEQRRAVHLAYFGGRTYRQVAAELGIPEGTAKSRLRLGLHRIAGALEAQGGAW